MWKILYILLFPAINVHTYFSPLSLYKIFCILPVIQLDWQLDLALLSPPYYLDPPILYKCPLFGVNKFAVFRLTIFKHWIKFIWVYLNMSTNDTSTDDISTDDTSTTNISTDDTSTDNISTHLLAEHLQHRPPLHRLFTTSTPLLFWG
jgi:hypothetical protein